MRCCENDDESLGSINDDERLADRGVSRKQTDRQTHVYREL